MILYFGIVLLLVIMILDAATDYFTVMIGQNPKAILGGSYDHIHAKLLKKQYIQKMVTYCVLLVLAIIVFSGG